MERLAKKRAAAAERAAAEAAGLSGDLLPQVSKLDDSGNDSDTSKKSVKS